VPNAGLALRRPVDGRGVTVWARAEGHIAFRDRTYAFRWDLAHPYDTPERAGDPGVVRKWQAAIVRDLLRQGARDRLSLSTALSWAQIDWARFEHEVRGKALEACERTPRTASARLHALSTAWLCLLLPETPASIRTRALRYRTSFRTRVAGIEVARLVDPVTGGMPSAPHHLHRAAFRALFPGSPFPSIPRKHGKGTPLQTIPVHRAYDGLVRLTAAAGADTR